MKPWSWSTKGLPYKFKNKPVVYNGVRYTSKLEASYAEKLDQWIKDGYVKFYLEQVPIRLPGGTKYIVDFVVFYTDDTLRFIDTKGMETDIFKIKKREVEAIYPFEIEVIKKGDF